MTIDRLPHRSRSQRPADTYFAHEDHAHVLRLQQRFRMTMELLRDTVGTELTASRVLDVGCGTGEMLCEYQQWGLSADRLAGIDVRADAVEQAGLRVPHATLTCGCASRMPWPDASFDVVSAYTVFSSILDESLRRDVAAEMLRVVRPGGVILFYDTVRENPHNPRVRPVSVGEARDLFAGTSMRTRRLTFLPHVARNWPTPVLDALYNILVRVPGLRSHQLVAAVKPG